MKICIDGLSLSNLSGTGYYSYLYGLSNRLFQIFPQPEYCMLLNKPILSEWEKYKNINIWDLEIDRHHNDYSALEKALKKERTHLYISPNNGFSLPANKVCKYMMIVHDMAPLTIPDLVDEKYTNNFKKVFPRALKNADSIIADSEFLKREIINYYDVDEKKISVMYPSCLPIFKPMKQEAVKSYLAKTYNICDKYFLYTGSIHPRKNLDVVISAFQSFVKEYNDYKLVLVGDYNGKRKKYYQSLLGLIEDYHLKNHVIFTGVVNPFDMPYFYNGATGVINISSYEGFPLTSVEASSCGIPYICLDNSSFSEIEIPTGIYLENNNPKDLKNTMNEVIKQEHKYISKNVQYSWDSEIKKMIRVIENLIYGS